MITQPLIDPNKDWTQRKIVSAQERLEKLPDEIARARAQLKRSLVEGELNGPPGFHKRVENLELEVARAKREIEILGGEADDE